MIYFIMTKETLTNITIFIISLVLIVDYGIKWCHFSFKGICGLKANNWGKCLILFVTALLKIGYNDF